MEERTLLSVNFQFHHVVYDPSASSSLASASVPSSPEIVPLSSSSPVGMTPHQIRTAYGIDSIMLGTIQGTGLGQTIAIIDAYDAPNFVDSTDPNFVNSDLYKFDHNSSINLPDPPSFRKLDEYGGTSYPAASGTSGWSVETSLDVEWAHAMAPQANIVLIEANGPTDLDLVTTAVNTARNLPGVTAVTMSFGRSESSSDTSLTSVFSTPAGHAGITFLASTGDDGSPGGFPAFAPNVVAVGGTTLSINPTTSAWVSETGWSDSGGGQSVYEAKPSYQSGVNTSSWRQIPDISFDADPASGVAVLDSYDYSSSAPWVQIGGTSVSSPCWAGLIAVGDQLRTSVGLGTMNGLTDALPLLYSMKAGDFHDIVTGSNGGFSAHAGYDEVTGIGSPITNKLVPDFVPVGPKGTVNFSARAYEIGTSATITLSDLDLAASPCYSVTLTSSTGDSETVSLPAQGGGVFRGSIVTAPGAASTGDGILQTAPGGTITVTYNDANDGTGNPAVVTDQATIFQVDHYAFATISSPKTAGVGFSVTVSAYDSTNALISGYNGTATLSGLGQSGALSISPTSVTFVSGVWTGNVAVNAVDPTVTLHVVNAAGAVGTSSTFATQPGPVASFQYSTIASPEYQNIAFPVTLTSKDANGYTVTSFNGTAALSGMIGTGITSPIMISEVMVGTPDTIEFTNVSGTSVNIGGWRVLVYDYDYPSTPQQALVVPTGTVVPAGGVFVLEEFGTSPGTYPHFYSGANFDWTESTVTGVLLLNGAGNVQDFMGASALNPSTITNPVTIVPANWQGSAVAALANEDSYSYQRVGITDHNTAADWVNNLAPSLGTLNTGLTVPWGTPVPVTPTTATFVNGVWTGNVTVQQAGTNIYLHVDDGAGHTSDSNHFDVSSLPPVTLAIPANATEGNGVVSGTLNIPSALGSDLVVSLASSDSGRVTVPATVTIPAGQTSAALPLTIVDNTLLDGPEAVVISATATGYAPAQSTITVHDNETAVLTVTLPTSAHEKDGTLLGTITSDHAPTRNITVQLISGDSSRLTVPASVTLLAGQTTVNFSATLLDDHVIEAGPTPVAVTAQTENWTSGSATVSLLDDDRTMTLGLPVSGWEGQTLTGTGTVQIGGTLTSDLVVSLLSADTAELTVPATVTIPHGQMTATFNVMLHSNGLRQGPQTVQVTATAAALPTANSSMVVKDADVDHFAFDTLTGPQTAGVAFSATVRAYDILNNPILVYSGATSLTATGSAGSLPITPTSVTFAAGVWTGSVSVNAVDPTVTLHVDNGAGIVGASNTFVVQSGPVASFQYSTIPSPEYQNVAFPVTLTAKDANGYTVTGFNGTATLKGFSGVQASLDSFDQGSSDLGNYTFVSTNNASITATAAHDGPYGLQLGDTTEWMYRNDASVHVQQGNTISVWVKSSTSNSGRAYFGFGATSTGTLSMTMGENTGTLLLQYVSGYGSYTDLASVSQTWTPNHWYRFDVDWRSGGTIVGRLYDSDGTTLLNSVTSSNTSITAGGIAFRGFGSTKYFDSVSGPVSTVTVVPGTATFVSGVWTGNVTVAQAAAGMYLQVNDGAGHAANSSAFDVDALSPATLTVPANATEGDGVVSGALMIPVALGSDLVVSLASSDTGRVTVPATITIPAGQTLVSLPLTIVDNALLDGPEAVVISATAAGLVPASATIAIHDNETATLTVTLPTSAHETAGVLMGAGTITSSAAPTRDITVQLLSSDVTGLTVPATVILRAGQTTANFNLTMVDDHVIQGDRPITITAQMENWTPGSATLTDLEDDATLTVALPASGWEGQTLTGAGTVQLGGTLTTDLAVSLASGDPTELSVPSTVTIRAGQRTATFNVTLFDNGLRTGPLTEQVTATAAGVTGGSATMAVDDSDVDHYGFATISSPQLTATAFPVTVRAYDCLNNVITVYSGSATLSGSGASGVLSVSPTSATFASGAWTGNVTVNAVDPTVTLQVSNGAGAVGTSNTFAVKTPLQVATTTPAPNGVFTLPGPFTYDVTFSEPITPSSVTTGDLVLSGVSGATVTGVTVLTGNTTARFTISGITTEGTLTASIATGAVTDQYGGPNVAFSASYAVDIGTVAFPTPLSSVAPSGSLIYSGTTSGGIAPSGDTDSFTIDLDAGQTITALADPASGLQPSITVRDPGGAVLATASSGAAGADAVVQTAAVSTAGTYMITIGGVGSTTGDYTVQVSLNAALEAESHNGPTNDTAATAQDITGSFTSLGGAATRGAVLGTADSSGDDFYSFPLNAGDRITAAIVGLSSGTIHVSLTDASGTVLATGRSGASNLTEVISDFAVTASGVYNAMVSGDAGMNYSLVLTRNASFDTEPNNSTATSQPLSTARSQGTALGYVEPSVVGVEPDNYAAGTVLTSVFRGITLTCLGSTSAVTSQTAPYHSTGTRVFSPGTDLTWSDTVLLRASFATLASSVSLDLVADNGSDLGFMKAYNSAGVLLQDLEPGAPPFPTPGFLTMTITRPTADIAYIVAGGQTGQVIYLDHLAVSGPSGGDYYGVSVNAGDPLVISTATPADGPNQFANSLDPKIELYDPTGTLVASDDNGGADGRNALLHYTATASGQYVVRVTGANGSTGAYVVHTHVGSNVAAVADVLVSSTDWTSSFLNAVDPGRGLGYSLPVGGGSQLVTLPWGNIDQIKVVFSEDVVVDQADLLLSGVNTPAYDVSGATFNYDSTTFTATWTLPQSISTDKLMISLNADGSNPIQDLAGNRLDGEWTNPASTTDPGGSVYPSGDGTPGGDFHFRLNVLPGDADRSGTVNFSDLSKLLASYGMSSGASWSQGDFTGDGAVNFTDLSKLLAFYGKSLPSGDPPAGSFPAAASLVMASVLTPVSSASAMSAAPITMGDIPVASTSSSTDDVVAIATADAATSGQAAVPVTSGSSTEAAVPTMAIASNLVTTSQPGLNAATPQKLTHGPSVIDDQPGSLLVEANETHLGLDANAPVNGWFINSAPTSSNEFTPSQVNQSLQAVDPRVVDQMDLSTVVERELGNIGGVNDLDALTDGAMSDVLVGGSRRNVSHLDAALASL
jgi:hypothetical protein